MSGPSSQADMGVCCLGGYWVMLEGISPLNVTVGFALEWWHREDVHLNPDILFYLRAGVLIRKQLSAIQI
jgi:hypothetical protein